MAAAGRLYSYLVTCRPCGEPAALTPKTRGRKPAPVDPHDRKIAELERPESWPPYSVGRE